MIVLSQQLQPAMVEVVVLLVVVVVASDVLLVLDVLVVVDAIVLLVVVASVLDVLVELVVVTMVVLVVVLASVVLVALVLVVDGPVLDVELVLVVVVTPGQVQSALHATNPPPGEPDGHERLLGGSHCSPGSRMALPHELCSVLDVVLEEVVVVARVELDVEDVVVVAAPPSAATMASRQLSMSSWTSPLAQLPALPSAF